MQNTSVTSNIFTRYKMNSESSLKWWRYQSESGGIIPPSCDYLHKSHKFYAQIIRGGDGGDIGDIFRLSTKDSMNILTLT
ncbi:MAG: hypothetical protein M3275_14175 [Thermoproteota archaeon]|nr:hypothetical protein [Thermoproteota archaeon]